MIGNWMTHTEYVHFVKEANERYKQSHSGDNLWRSEDERKLVEKMLYLDIDLFMPLVTPLYSNTGRPSTPPDRTLRTWFLFVMTRGGSSFGAFGVDDWIRKTIVENPLIYTLIGCRSGLECPSIGTCYGLLDKLWQGSRERYSRDAQYGSRKNCRNGKFEIGSDSKAVDQEFTVEDTAKRYKAGERLSANYEMMLQQMLAVMGVFPSISNGCIPNVCCGSIDSTAYYEPASRYGKTDCGKARMDCPYRRECGTSATYSSPDGSIGYDSGKGCPFHGEHLHVLSVYNWQAKVQVPICFSLMDAPRHDSIAFFVLLQETLRNVLRFHMDFFLGDCAFDHKPIYITLLEDGTVPLIGLNGKTIKYEGLPKGITINSQGIPTCKEGHEMAFFRNDEATQCWMYRCPMLSTKGCTCEHQQDCPYRTAGRLLTINPKDSPRFFTVIPRGSEEFKLIFFERSAAERLNNRLLHDYNLEGIKMHNADHRSFLVAAASICVHIDAWIKMGLKPPCLTASEYAQLFGRPVEKDYESRQMKAEIDWESIKALNDRNQKERKVNAERQEQVAIKRKELKPVMDNSEEGWECPRVGMATAESEKKPGVLGPEAPAVTPFELRGYEAHSLKSWEVPYLGYVHPEIVVDPLDQVYPHTFGTGSLAGFEVISRPIFNAKDPRTYNGFTEAFPNVWVRKPPPLYIKGEGAEGVHEKVIPEIGEPSVAGTYRPPMLDYVESEARDAWMNADDSNTKRNPCWCMLPNSKPSDCNLNEAQKRSVA